jgi:hypothetical protein
MMREQNLIARGSIDCIEPAFDDTFGTTAHGEMK